MLEVFRTLETLPASRTLKTLDQWSPGGEMCRKRKHSNIFSSHTNTVSNAPLKNLQDCWVYMSFPQPTDAILNWTELRWFNLDSRQMSTHLLAAKGSPNMDHDTNTLTLFWQAKDGALCVSFCCLDRSQHQELCHQTSSQVTRQVTLYKFSPT